MDESSSVTRKALGLTKKLRAFRSKYINLQVALLQFYQVCQKSRKKKKTNQQQLGEGYFILEVFSFFESLFLA